MAGKRRPQPPKEDKRPPVAEKAPAAGRKTMIAWLWAAAAVLLTLLVFMGVTKLTWTNWDDDEYVYENEMVKQGDYGAIFSDDVNNNYNPLPVAMHALEWKLTEDAKDLKDRAWLFHLNNLWMHLLCTLLAFWVMRKLGLDPVWAFLAALLFGIHPMRVESVAWVTERKDVMFGAFYLGALLCYLHYVEKRNWLWLLPTLGLMVLSLLSKIQAVSLPLSMMAIDWYKGRAYFPIKGAWRVWAEKVPFFLAALAVGLLGVMILQANKTLAVPTDTGVVDRFAMGFANFFTYVVKVVVPYETCAYYPTPAKAGVLHYLGMVGGLGLIGLAVVLRKRSRAFTFGMAFFTVNIVFLLQIVAAGSAFNADRFTYIAYLGLFFALAMEGQRLAAARPALRLAILAALGLLCAVCGAITVRYIPVWADSDTLWTDVIEKYPRRAAICYVNRGQYLRREQQSDRALADFNTAIELQPEYHLSYLNRGNIYFDRGQDDLAIADYTQLITMESPFKVVGEREPSVASAYSNRGAIYARKKLYAEAIADLDKAISLDAGNKDTWNNRAITHFELGEQEFIQSDAATRMGNPEEAKSHLDAGRRETEAALADFRKFLEFDPKHAGAVNTVGVCYMRLGKWQESLAEFAKAIQLDPKMGNIYSNRAFAHANLGNRAAALQDLQTAQSLGHQVDPAFMQSLQQQ